MSHKQARQNALQQWVSEVLQCPITLTRCAGDAGFRCYYAMSAAPTLLAVDAPPATENTAQFVAVAKLLRNAGVVVPDIHAADAQQGFMLVQNLGQQEFGGALNSDNALTLYGEALFTLLAIAQAPADTASLPLFDQAFMARELALFNDWFVGPLLGLTLSATEQTMLEATFEQLIARALQQPQVVMHRDYHSRNLLIKADASLGVIDFQDAVIGPLTYDAVSLLRDCYVRLPAAAVRRWALAYGDMAIDAGIMPAIAAADYLQDFDWMGLQRHIKVLGIFARLHLRDGKSSYLKDLPRVMAYVQEVAACYPGLQEFAAWFAARITPACKTQPWYQPQAAYDITVRGLT
ncbi:aminoglycoside phosphotransferase family protein [Gilvimarinus polysaccharolyticus]|uniref:aminoglycoside phosphotransferase family protein n=1 Tax=Gilvimarinus polysaccharolyticus TaxID=863921 RepID=UPI000673A940|nr:phosphotransferase [Gilvimarinus polysaccharolyticus]